MSKPLITDHLHNTHTRCVPTYSPHINTYKAKCKVTKVNITLFTRSLRTRIELVASRMFRAKCAWKADESNFCVGAQRRVSYENYAPFEGAEQVEKLK